MKAILHTKYGPPDELQLREIEKPFPRDDEVLIKIKASTVTTSDCNIRNLTFAPTLFKIPARIQLGFRKPKFNILGIDLAGDVVAVGTGVKQFKEGDQVFGSSEPGLGAHAEFISLPERSVLGLKPSNLTYEEAAAIPLAANTALFFIRDQGTVQDGHNVLINGASGGIGTFAVQLSKFYGAKVTGVCSTRNLDLVSSIGADRVIDYTKDDFTKDGDRYDVVFDVVGKTSFSHCKDLLNDNGVYLATVPTLSLLLQMVIPGITSNKKVKNGDAVINLDNLYFLQELAVSGKLKPIIDRCFPLEQMAEAFRYVEEGHKKGNVVITVSP